MAEAFQEQVPSDIAKKLLWVRALLGKSLRKPRSCWSGILSSIIIMAEICLVELHNKPRSIMMSLLKLLNILFHKAARLCGSCMNAYKS